MIKSAAIISIAYHAFAMPPTKERKQPVKKHKKENGFKRNVQRDP